MGAFSPLPTSRLPDGPGWVPSTARLPAGHPLCLCGETLVLPGPGRAGVQPPTTITPCARSPRGRTQVAAPGSAGQRRGALIRTAVKSV